MPGVITIDSWVREAALVVAAKAIRLEGRRGRFEVLRTLKGSFKGREFEAALLETQSCIGPRDPAPFPVGSEVVLFLGPEQRGVFPVVGNGIAWMKLSAPRQAEVLEAVSRIVEIEALPTPEARIGAYLVAVESANPTLGGAARCVICRDLCGKEKAAPWEDRLVSLIGSPVQEARLAAIQALQHSRSEKALPALLEAIDDENRSVRECASMALAPYDTETTVRKLIEAFRRPDMKARVLIDLRGSRRPEARAVLEASLGSEDPRIRALAAGSFYEEIHAGDPVILKFHRLVDDADLEVRFAALSALHKSRHPESADVLLRALRRKDLSPRELRVAVSSLAAVIRAWEMLKPPKSIQEARDLPGILERGLRDMDFAASSAIWILAMLDSQEAWDVLTRARDGAFGTEPAEAARKMKERLEAR